MIQIVTGLPPSVDGLGDYALALGRAISSAHAIPSAFIVSECRDNGPATVEGFHVKYMRRKTLAAFVSAFMALVEDKKQVSPNSPILLHYSGYGYQPRGCPIWLTKALEWVKATWKSRVVVMFHELYAFGPPWRSSFWTSPIQRAIVRGIASVADEIVTNTETYQHYLGRTGAVNPHRIPVMSTLGEPNATLPVTQRERRLVVLGRATRRKALYQKWGASLNNICALLRVNEVIDIGPPVDSRTSPCDGLKISQMGILTPTDISSILWSSYAGLISETLLERSTVFAAYCAHGMIPVNLSAPTGYSENTNPSVQCLDTLDDAQAQHASDLAFRWYQDHTSARHADLFQKLLSGAIPYTR